MLRLLSKTKQDFDKNKVRAWYEWCNKKRYISTRKCPNRSIGKASILKFCFSSIAKIINTAAFKTMF
jgi:hypothetical protein